MGPTDDTPGKARSRAALQGAFLMLHSLQVAPVCAQQSQRGHGLYGIFQKCEPRGSRAECARVLNSNDGGVTYCQQRDLG